MSRIVSKKNGEGHFTNPLGGGTTSRRVILPGPDACRVKVTCVHQKEGFHADRLINDVDETVYVVEGQLTLHGAGGMDTECGPGDTFHVRAGVPFGVTARTDGILNCVFSQAADGTMPNDK